MKVTGPLFSESAHGDFAGLFRYQRRGSVNYVKKINKLPTTTSAAQLAWRQHYKDTWDAWYGLSFFQKILYIIMAVEKGWASGQHAYLFMNL